MGQPRSSLSVRTRQYVSEMVLRPFQAEIGMPAVPGAVPPSGKFAGPDSVFLFPARTMFYPTRLLQTLTGNEAHPPWLIPHRGCCQIAAGLLS
jgi:hypothetical protein